MPIKGETFNVTGYRRSIDHATETIFDIYYLEQIPNAEALQAADFVSL